jgi:hypothetical protein
MSFTSLQYDEGTGWSNVFCKQNVTGLKTVCVWSIPLVTLWTQCMNFTCYHGDFQILIIPHFCGTRIEYSGTVNRQSRLGGVVVSVLATRPKGHSFKPNAMYFNGDKIRSTSSFGWEVKPEAPCRNILRHVKEHSGAWLRCNVSKIQGHFSPSPWVTVRYLWCSQAYLNSDGDVQYIIRICRSAWDASFDTTQQQ